MKRFLKHTHNVYRRELKRIGRYPTFSTLTVVLPVLCFAFFMLFFQKGNPRDISIAVLDEDQTPMSRQLMQMIDATPTVNVDFRVTDIESGERMIREGVIEAVVCIPAGFEKDIFSNRQTRVEAFINATNITANGLIGKDIQSVVTSFSVGTQTQILMKTGMTEKQAMAQSMPVYFERHTLFNPYLNYGYYLLPSFLPIMLMLFVVLSVVFAVGSELKDGRAGEWFAVAGGQTSAAIVGKMIPYTILFTVMYLFMNVLLFKWMSVPLNGSHTLLTISGIIMILGYQSIGLAVIAMCGTLRRGLSIGGGYSTLAFTFSGLTFPRMAMVPVMQLVAYIFPFTLYTDIFVDQALRGAPIRYSLGYVAGLFVYLLVAIPFMPRLKRICTNKNYWGRL